MTNRRRTGHALLVVALAIAARSSALGCDDGGAHVFAGEEYNPTLQCLEPVSSIDVVAGPEPGSCAPVCIVSLQDGGKVAYVSTMCPPYPVFRFETDAGGDPICIAAMAAFGRNSLCADGGVVLPAGDAAVDGGGEGGEAGADSGTAAQDAAGGDA